MDGAPPAAAPKPPEAPSEAAILRTYYKEIDFFLSAEGILKVLSVVLCITSSVVFLSGWSSCGAAAPALVAGGGALALAAGGALALLCAAVVLALPPRAPLLWLYTDIIISTVLGVMLLVTAILSMSFCDMTTIIDYINGPLMIVNACAVVGSAVITYAAVTRRWDSARGPRVEPPRPQPTDVEV